MSWGTRPNVRILFVDDKESWLIQATLFLERHSSWWKVETARSAREALEMLAKDQFDVVVSDYLMPGMDGLEFLDTLRTQGNDIPFIIFTGKGREEVAMRALNLGADHYLRKGADPEAQYKLLAQAIAKEIKIKREKKRYEQLFNSLPDAVFVHNFEGNFYTVNTTAREQFEGLQAALSDKFADLPERDLQTLKDKKKNEFEVRYSGKNGDRLSVEVHSQMVDYFGTQRIISVARDISKRKEAEKKISDLQSLLTSMRKINHLLDEEPEEAAMQKSAHLLHEVREYKGLSISLLNQDGQIAPCVQLGEINRKKWTTEPNGEKEAPKCIQKVINSKSLEIIAPSSECCAGCTYCKNPPALRLILIPMNHAESIIGVLTVGIDSNHVLSKEEIELLTEVAHDLGFSHLTSSLSQLNMFSSLFQ